MSDMQTIVGVDEAGRGPLAGPVYVGLVVARKDFEFAQFPDLTDSKQMKESEREDIYESVITTNNLPFDYTIRYTTASVINKEGITTAVRQAINRGLRNLDLSTENTKILLDGRLQAPDKYPQETITKGDRKKPIISLASVLAKVARDRWMKKIDDQYDFDFASHKGYGTKQHRSQIKKCGVSEIHRQYFLSS